MMSPDVVAVLPKNVRSALQDALRTLPGNEAARVWAPANEGALNHVVLIETPHGRSVFRMRRESSSAEIFAYLNATYQCTGFPELGGIFGLRSIEDEVAFMRRALARGLPVAQVLRDGGDWMLIEFIDGRTAYASVKEGDLSVVTKVVETLRAAHQQGVIYGDRWGDNEFIDRYGRVRLIDFDVEWTLAKSRSDPRMGILEALEVAVYLFHTLRLTSDRRGMLQLTSNRIAPQLRAWSYDMECVSEFVRGLARFYLDQNKPVNAWSGSASLYRALPEPAGELVRLLRTA